jgi:CheY-like chemotaxis protein
MEKVSGIVGFKIEEKHQVFQYEISETVPQFVLADDQRITQVITNLLSNASKFTPEHGRIDIHIFAIEDMGDQCEIQINVRDTGIGISPEQQERLFNPFQQADASTTKKYGGTGLGLVITKHIVELMDGEIWLESCPGKGSTFSFTIVVKKAIGNAISRYWTASGFKTDIGPDGALEDYSAFKVLLAEDLEVNREIVEALLEPTRICFESVENGREAVERYRAAPEDYHLILMDIRMPEMDGYEATQQIRKIEASTGRHVPIIALTANAFNEDINRCLSMGMDAHIGKPLNADDLYENLRRLLKEPVPVSASDA